MQYRVLGPLEVLDAGGSPLPVHGAKLRGLVALLALEAGRVVSAERLITALYDEPPLRVENALQQLVSKLRRILANGRVVTRAPGYLLDEPASAVDALRFEDLLRSGRAAALAGDVDRASAQVSSALGLWRGEALGGVALNGEAAGIKVRLDELRSTATEDRIDYDLRRGLHAELVAELEALVAAAPLRERRQGQLILALYRCGRQSDALKAYRNARRTLDEELGVEPGPELRKLEAAVLAQDAALAPPSASPTRPAAVQATPAVPHSPPHATPTQPSAHSPAQPTPPAQPGPPAPPSAPPAQPGPSAEPTPSADLPRAAQSHLSGAGQIRPPRTACLGRSTELDRLTQLVAHPGLTTLVGPGGVGKTRLALELATVLQQRLADGVRWVELASVTAGGVAAAVGRAAGYDDTADLLDGLGSFLSRKQVALVLDNCEHLVDEVATFAEDLLDRAPGLWILATSREGLSVPGEVLFPVPPLEVPAAVALFAERAQAAGAAVDPADPVVAGICVRLDGLPLAVELAAARTRHLSVREIADRLDERFDLLTRGPRTAVARQRTLRAVIDWSHALLDDDERALFARLSLFETGFTAEAAEAVGTLDVLAALVDKSLVVADVTSGETRYRLLETVREYGREQLASDHEQFVDYYVDLAERAERGLLSSEYRCWQQRLERELPNLRAAVAHADRARELRIASALWWFWGSTDRHHQGRSWLEAALPGAPPDLVRAKALVILGYLAGQQLDLREAVEAGEEGLALSIELGGDLDIAAARQTLGLTLEAAGEHERSKELLAAAREVWDAEDLHQQVASNDIVTCVRALDADDLEVVDETSREVLRRAELVGFEPYLCWGHLLRARLEEARDDLPSAAEECAKAVQSARRLGLAHLIAFALVQQGRITACTDDLAEAVQVAEEAGAGWFAALAKIRLAEALGTPPDVPARPSGGGRVTFYVRIGGDPYAPYTGTG